VIGSATAFTVWTPAAATRIIGDKGTSARRLVPASTLQTPGIKRPELLAKPLILVVEDASTYLALRKKVLQQAGYNVIGVTSSGDALEALREAPVCTVIADNILQGTTGVELAKEMKKIKPNVPIILFSGTVPEHLSGIDVYVNKAEPTAKFLGIVREVVERYRL
jgi:CheY-like chemotaxis protein